MAKAGETQDRCTQYALDVVSGKITAGEYVRLACQRHLDDIEKSKAAPYKYYFDVEKSEEIINFAEELTIAEGEENEHVTAYPFQCFIRSSTVFWHVITGILTGTSTEKSFVRLPSKTKRTLFLTRSQNSSIRTRICRNGSKCMTTTTRLTVC